VSSTIANPRRTTLAMLRSGSRCEVAGPGCRRAATRLVVTAGGAQHLCAVCATR